MESKQRKRIAVLGSTGSIGTQTIDIIERWPDRFEAVCLVAGSRVDTLIEQCRRLRPRRAIIADRAHYAKLQDALQPLGIECATGSEAVAYAMAEPDVDMVVTATVGYSGLAPTISAINAGKEIALANKETLVVAGDLVTSLLRGSKSRIIPVDSEHSAIYQCLVGESREAVSRLIITASGGPFRTMPKEQLAKVTPADALRHPKWEMGAKITIDSATMLNKAFEIIEARWLFDVDPDRITAVVHPQSIVHSMVEFTDGAVKAQLGVPDMHLPISYALGLEERLTTDRPTLTLADYAHLTFEEPDLDKFPCLGLARYSLERGGNTACVVNAANEIANEAFRRGRIGFNSIYRVITDTIDHATFVATPTLADYVESNHEARDLAEEIINRHYLLD
ncbi:MAG: 1-deoxy-D-xylulose-5-phosphate reductoisomerase [Muribaculaceae bacterium]|nr:1-deoxy-D-xylulose-5-phosphate reductoisomerase [Muribaculaceae bacterium]